jgi:hypothetical protein
MIILKVAIGRKYIHQERMQKKISGGGVEKIRIITVRPIFKNSAQLGILFMPLPPPKKKIIII